MLLIENWDTPLLLVLVLSAALRFVLVPMTISNIVLCHCFQSFLFVSNTKEVTGYILAEEVTKVSK